MTQYATQADLTTLSINANALTGIAGSALDAALVAASTVADGFLTKRFVLPLSQWGQDLRQAVSDIAAYRVLKVRGFNPEKGDAEQLRLSYEDAMRWLKLAGDGAVVPTGVVDASPGGINNTNAAGEQAVDQVVYQPRSSTTGGSSRSGAFWNKDGCSTGGSSSSGSRKRGW